MKTIATLTVIVVLAVLGFYALFTVMAASNKALKHTGDVTTVEQMQAEQDSIYARGR